MLNTYLVPAADLQPRRLMVVLHGLGDSVDGYRWLPEAMGLPWLSYLLVNAPDGYYGGYSWYDIYGDSGPGVRRSRQMLFELLDYKRQQGWLTENTVLFGFSQGCLMCLDVAARYPQRLAGVVGVSGYVYEPDQLVREMAPVAPQQRFLITHGTFDPLIQPAPVKVQIEQLQKAGLAITWHEFPKAHTIGGEPEVAVIRAFVAASFPPAS